MNIKEFSVLASRCVAFVTAIPAIRLFGQILVVISLGGESSESIGKLIALALPSILIWFAAPSLTIRRYGRESINDTKCLRSIVLFITFVAFGSFAVVEAVTFFIAAVYLPDLVNSYKVILMEKSIGLSLIVVCVGLLYLKIHKQKPR